MRKLFQLCILGIVALGMSSIVAAGSISITSVDLPDTVTQGDSFSTTVHVSGSNVQSGSVTSSLTLPDGLSCDPTSAQSISLNDQGTGSASWDCDADASGDYSNEITASVSATDSGSGGSLSDSTQAGITVQAPASLVISSSLDSTSITTSGSTTFTVTIQNTGDVSTTYSVSTSPGGVTFSKTSGSESGSIAGDGLETIDYDVSSSSANTYSVTADVSGGNGQSISTSQSLTVTSSSNTNNNNNNGGGSSSSSGGSTVSTTGTSTASKAITSQRQATGLSQAPGIQGNEKLEQAIAQVLNKAELAAPARKQLETVSEAIAKDTTVTRDGTVANGTTEITTNITYSGNKSVDQFMFHDTIPKDFARNASAITVVVDNAQAQVVEKDPSYLITDDTAEAGETYTVSYSTDDASIDSESELDSLLSDFNASVYGNVSQAQAPVDEQQGTEETDEQVQEGETTGQDTQQKPDSGFGGLATIVAAVLVGVLVIGGVTYVIIRQYYPHLIWDMKHDDEEDEVIEGLHELEQELDEYLEEETTSATSHSDKSDAGSSGGKKKSKSKKNSSTSKQQSTSQSKKSSTGTGSTQNTSQKKGSSQSSQRKGKQQSSSRGSKRKGK